MTMRQRTAKLFWFSIGATLLVCIASLFVALYIASSENNHTSKENQGYVRYLACVTEIRNTRNVVAITKETSDYCWDTAEKQVGVMLARYSESEAKRALAD